MNKRVITTAFAAVPAVAVVLQPNSGQLNLNGRPIFTAPDGSLFLAAYAQTAFTIPSGPPAAQAYIRMVYRYANFNGTA